MGMQGSKAADAAAQADTQRQNQIAQSVAQVNKAYGSPERQQQYDTYGANLKNYFTGQVKDQEAVNARNLKFAMARSGLTGGSASVDSNNQLQKDFAKGLLSASQQAQGGVSALQQSDINAKNQMIGLVQQGNYTGAIPQQVQQAQNAALGTANNFGNASALGNLFSGTGEIYKNEQTAAANRMARITPIGSLYGGSSTPGSL
jgi:hypothetical protein